MISGPHHALSVGLRTATAPGKAAYSPAPKVKKHAEIPAAEVLGFLFPRLFRKVQISGNLTGLGETR